MAQAKQPIIDNSRGFNIFTSIWIVPMIALIISGWLVYQHFSKLGPEIRIVFSTSGGLEAGKSVIKYRNVPIGKVTRIEVQEGGEGVVVVARMNKETRVFVNETTRFWVVKPKVDYSGVSGLDTLISGSYIAMYAEESEVDKDYFEGLKTPYRDLNSGEYYLLHSKSSSSIRVGTPINYRNVQVGQIEHVILSHDGMSVEIVAFVKKEYTKLINTTTKFWLQSLASIGLNGDRVDIELAPLLSYLAFGGITFESKLDKEYPKVDPDYFFRLYNNYHEAEIKKIGAGTADVRSFIFKFQGKMSGLKTGASIRYQGFDVGEVNKVDLYYDSENRTMKSSVLGGIDVSIFEDNNKSGFQNLKDAVADGMRARLVSTNPLLNALSVDLFFSKNSAPVALVDSKDNSMPFPVSGVQQSSLLNELTIFVNKLNELKINELLTSSTKLIDDSAKPLQATLLGLEQTIASFKNLTDSSSDPLSKMMSAITDTSNNLSKTLGGIDGITGEESIKDIPKKLNIAMEELGETLKSTKRVLRGYRSNSLFGKRVTQMLKEINQSSEETKRLLRKLNKKPNSVIFGD